jgi:hypothetical protein
VLGSVFWISIRPGIRPTLWSWQCQVSILWISLRNGPSTCSALSRIWTSNSLTTANLLNLFARRTLVIFRGSGLFWTKINLWSIGFYHTAKMSINPNPCSIWLTCSATKVKTPFWVTCRRRGMRWVYQRAAHTNLTYTPISRYRSAWPKKVCLIMTRWRKLYSLTPKCWSRKVLKTTFLTSVLKLAIFSSILLRKVGSLATSRISLQSWKNSRLRKISHTS